MLEDAQQWDKQQIANQASFLQSSLWGEFQKSLGHQPNYLQGAGWSCLAIERKTKLGNYLFAPYGPTISSASDFAKALATIKKLGQDLGVAWLRIEPFGDHVDSNKIIGGLKAAGGKPAPHNVEPDATRIVNIAPATDDVLATISPSTRSLIRKNQRSGQITFSTSTTPTDMSIFSQMLATVAQRNKVGFFSEDYFLKQAEILMPAGMMRLELAYDNGKPVAGIVVHDYGQVASYTYAGSLPEARDKSVSALLVWQAIVNAKQRGRQKFDLFGVAPAGAPASHPWYGFSMFKQKFGGEVIERAGTWDIPLTAKYHLYRVARRAKKIV